MATRTAPAVCGYAYARRIVIRFCIDAIAIKWIGLNAIHTASRWHTDHKCSIPPPHLVRLHFFLRTFFSSLRISHHKCSLSRESTTAGWSVSSIDFHVQYACITKPISVPLAHLRLCRLFICSSHDDAFLIRCWFRFSFSEFITKPIKKWRQMNKMLLR